MVKNKPTLQNILCAGASAIIALLLPLCASFFVSGVDGIAVHIILLLVVNPLAAVCVGVFSGLNMKKSWFLPFVFAALFLLGAWIFLEAWESAFLLYSLAYLAISYAAALVTWLIKSRKK